MFLSMNLYILLSLWLLPFSVFKDPCEYNEPTRIIQENLPSSGLLISKFQFSFMKNGLASAWEYMVWTSLGTIILPVRDLEADAEAQFWYLSQN